MDQPASSSSNLPHEIPLDQAIEMTTLFRTERENILEPAYHGLDIFPICETFNKNDVEALLNQQQCVSIRIYYGMDADLKVHAILVGVDENGADILPGVTTGLLLEDATRCPIDCPPPSPLNQ